MKKIIVFFIFIATVILLGGCKNIYRVYDDDELSDLAKDSFAFSEVLTFKIVYAETALELTGRAYNNAGVIIGIKDDFYSMVFVPKMVADNPFLLDLSFTFNLRQIYSDLRLINETYHHENPSGYDFFSDYGGLSITVEPYASTISENPQIDLITKIFFRVTTDEHVYSVGFVEEGHIIFDENNAIIE